MNWGVPTRPATAWNGARAESIHRVRCEIPALKGAAAAKDLNRSGLLLETPSPLKVGSHHLAELSFEGLRVRLPLRVSHVDTRYESGAAARHRVGLVFRLSNTADEIALDRLLRALNAAPAEPMAA